MAIEYPVKLKLMLDKSNLSSIKNGIESKLSKQAGGVAGSVGGAAQKESTKTQKGILGKVGKIALGLGLLGVIAGILSSLEPVTFLMSSLLSVISVFLSPIVLLFLTLFKPFLLLFIRVGLWMFKFFRDPVGALKGLFDGLTNFFTEKTSPEKAESVGVGIGQATGAVVGGILGSALGPVGTVLGALLGGIIGGLIVKFGMLLGEGLAWIVKKAYDFGTLLGTYLAEFIWWLWEKLQAIWTWTQDFGSWLWDSVTSVFSKSLNVLSGIGSWIKNKIMSFFSFGRSSNGQHAFGGEISKEGNYYLHAGEKVVPASKNSGGGGGTVNLTINLNGGATKSDADTVARKVLQELKRYGVY